MPDSHSFAPAYDARLDNPRTRAPQSREGILGTADGGEVDNDSFNPSSHTVDEVKAYVTENPDYLTEILEAEQEGKARVTLIEWLDTFGES
jgi:hypothetical protein